MSDYGEIRLLRDIGQPNVRLITSVGAAHTETIGSVQGVARCKQEIFDGARAGDWVIVNVDDEHIRQMPLPKGAGILRFGMGERADVAARTRTSSYSVSDSISRFQQGFGGQREHQQRL